jgi:HTH-type transcriptional regulator, transcriptional repressor of NAD biosynthesis genes
VIKMKDKTIGFIGGKYLPFHQGHVYTILAASNQVDTLYVVLSSSKNRDRELCERDGIKYMSAEKRLSWIGKSLNDLDNIKIIHIEDDQWDHDYNWEDGARMINEAIGQPIDKVFSSEPEYSKYFSKFYPGSEHVIVDDKRKTITISATELREDLYGNWDKLPKSVQTDFVKKVAIVGTESCGKTTLAKKLSKFYNTTYVHEVGHKYCEEYKNQLTPDMFNFIAMEHMVLQRKKSEEANKILFVDSETTISQYYLDMYFNGQHSPLIDEITKIQDYDLVLYLEPDVTWVDNGVRFAGEDEVRKQNNVKLKQMLQERGIEYVPISGSYQERFDNSRTLVDKLFE